MTRYDEQASQILKGAYDLHVHTAPDAHLPRVQDDIDFARDALAHGMRGCVIKNHHTLTTDRAALVRKVVPDFECFGGICLDSYVGGLNPFAVEAALGFIGDQQLCRIVWMPTTSAAGYARKPAKDPGWSVVDEGGQLRAEVFQILELIRSYDCALATGHLRVSDQRVLLKEAHAMGLTKIIVTHVDSPPLAFNTETQAEFTQYGYLEHCVIHSLPTNAAIPLTRIVADIKNVGPQRCFLSSDLGQDFNPFPVAGLHTFIAGLLRAGLTYAELEIMTSTNPGLLVS